MSSQSGGREGATVLKVVLLGEGGVGKSSLLNRYVKDIFHPRCAHTVGVEFLKKQVKVGGREYVLQIWDTAGQERFKSLRTPFYRGADICVFVFAIDKWDSFERLHFWLNEFVRHAGVEDVTQFPFVVVGNKADADQIAREVGESEAEDWCCRKGPFPYLETSAKDSLNVSQLFSSAIHSWSNLNNSAASEGLEDPDTVRLSSSSTSSSRQGPKHTFKCCA